MAEAIFTTGVAPGTPSTGKVTVYAKTDKLMYAKDDAGFERALSSSGLTHAQVLKRVSLRA